MTAVQTDVDLRNYDIIAFLVLPLDGHVHITGYTHPIGRIESDIVRKRSWYPLGIGWYGWDREKPEHVLKSHGKVRGREIGLRDGLNLLITASDIGLKIRSLPFLDLLGRDRSTFVLSVGGDRRSSPFVLVMGYRFL